MSNIFSNRIVCLWEEGKERPEILADIERYFGTQHCDLAEQILDNLEAQFIKYQEEEDMTVTFEAKPHYYYQSQILDNLCDQFGEQLEGLTAVEKWQLLATIAMWQAEDTDLQYRYNRSVSFSGWLGYNLRNLDISENGKVATALQLLKDSGDEEALALARSLPSQLANGVYLND